MRPLIPTLMVLAAGAAPLPACASLATQGTAVSEPQQAPASAAASELTLERIMADPAWIARSPSGAMWADDSLSFYYRRERADDFGLTDLFQVDLISGETRRLPDEELGLVPGRGGVFDRERARKLFERHGDLILLDRSTGQERVLTRTSVDERPIGFLDDGTLALEGVDAIVFERGGDLLARDLTDGFEWELVDVSYADDPEAEGDEKAEDRDYLALQQERLLASVRDERARNERRRERAEELRDADPTRPPGPIYVGKGWRELSRSLSPDGRWLALEVTKSKSSGGKRDSMPEFVTDSSWVENRTVRAHVGYSERDDTRLMLVDAAGRSFYEFDFGDLPMITDDPLAFLDEEPPGEASEEESDDEGDATEGDNSRHEPAAAPAAKPRPVTAGSLNWSPDSRRAVTTLRSHDNKDLWLVALETPPPGEESTPTLRLIHHQHDEAWVNGGFRDSDWLDDGRLWFLSEASGYSHLYLWDPTTGEGAAMTSGAFEVSRVSPSWTTPHLYYRANVDDPGIYDVWRLDTETGAAEQITDLDGRTGFVLSPDGQWLLLDNDRALRPTELYLQEARPGAQAKRMTFTVEPQWAALPWVAPQFVAVPSNHGRPIHSRLYLPPAEVAAAAGQRPAVLFVHGAGYLQNAHHGWSSYFREFMFHSLLAWRGYVVLDMDYRASAGYGRDWRTAIYRQMGTPELEDLVDGVEWLVANHGVDPERVGLYGGSYGGFMTLMALFKAPEVFAAGAALRPVTDWAHYNHGYTANILNTPERDPEAFERSSPIEFAEGLADPLLICHGMVDDNVLAKDSIRLAQKLIDLGKDGWELALYPVEAHGFEEPASWRDEYSRILQLFEEHLRGGASEQQR
ncbi:S9 family peptidase [Engelhardtia mirabilis]|uniref:Prolyl tripeptidyl peptidase n=1 Tax=Engelhardtia mirabilis TaxID=2528011 RepID=A0A518BI67_9BACT|nr:Prolyl tripeptidyl peptidase precursor [Planctomycetes bacterium Pla133]QDV00959.1 Prolyl tripeptidyl peptidase precursor [Planctomycetes bacterium Pla86]